MILYNNAALSPHDGPLKRRSILSLRPLLIAKSLLVKSVLVSTFIVSTSVVSTSAHSHSASCPDFLNRSMPKLHSSKTVNPCQLGDFKAVLVVNTASHCGFTPQFKELEALHKAYKDKGLLVLGFPSDDFFQEADSESETAEVCYKNYGVTFPMFKAVKVRGKSADPVFQAIAAQGKKPKWNFFKFLLDSEGHLIESFSSKTKPNDEKFLKVINQSLSI